MKTKEWLKALAITLLLLVCGLMPAAESPRLTAAGGAYQRIVVLADIHLPVRPEVKAPALRQRILAAKEKAIADINAWSDVGLVAVIGDLAAGFGTDAERAYAAGFFARLAKPQAIVLGNHDYIYEDSLSRFGTRVRASAELRAVKIRKFQAAFQLPDIYYSRQAGRYLLVFLSTDSLDSGQLTQLSAAQLAWLRRELASQADRPTIVFFHAPLKGTVTDYSETANLPDFVAQPSGEIAALLRSQPQVFLWVSGHIHLPADKPDFAGPVNLLDGRVTNIHNADLDRTTIWTNSLYLYPDRVVVRTYDHAAGHWLAALDRTIVPPQSLRIPAPWQR